MAEVVLFDSGRDFFSAHAPQPLRFLLHSATLSENATQTEALLIEARSRFPGEPDAHIALYKFYFVLGRYIEAERTVWRSINEAAKSAKITRNYRRLSTQTADWKNREGPTRWYLFNLKALGVVRLRRERAHEAQRVLQKLLELDPFDEIGGGAFLQIARAVTGADDE
ncbi:MAG: hypothetical protein QM709_12615 [Spongiibacteraceae bacterium]